MTQRPISYTPAHIDNPDSYSCHYYANTFAEIDNERQRVSYLVAEKNSISLHFIEAFN